MTFTRLSNFQITGFKTLQEESINEGFNFLVRLEKEWQSGKNKFLLTGEGIYGVFEQQELIAIGGINRDTYVPSNHVGRLRRFYVKKSWRRKVIGKKLLFYILERHFPFFETIRLHTNNPTASDFYITCGFKKLNKNQEKASHKMNRTSYHQLDI